MDAEVDRRIASASKAFGALRPAVFNDRNLNVNTKRQVYRHVCCQCYCMARSPGHFYADT